MEKDILTNSLGFYYNKRIYPKETTLMHPVQVSEQRWRITKEFAGVSTKNSIGPALMKSHMLQTLNRVGMRCCRRLHSALYSVFSHSRGQYVYLAWGL